MTQVNTSSSNGTNIPTAELLFVMLDNEPENTLTQSEVESAPVVADENGFVTLNPLNTSNNMDLDNSTIQEPVLTPVEPQLTDIRDIAQALTTTPPAEPAIVLGQPPVVNPPKTPKGLVPLDVTDLMDKFGAPKQKKQKKPKQNTQQTNTPTEPPVKQRAVLLVPAHRQATSYLQRAFNNSDSVGGDGVDHINISAMAKTKLGKFLDINTHTPFKHRELGEFASVGGLWFYVKCENNPEIFRETHDSRTRNLGRDYKFRNVDGFMVIIADAMWMKVVAYPDAAKDLAESTLPFKNYYYHGALKMLKHNPESQWFTAAVNEIRRCLKERLSTGNDDLFPDFSFLEN